MKTLLNRIVCTGAAAVFATSLVSAIEFNPDETHGSKCYAMVADYAGGMTSIKATASKPAAEQVTAVAAEFRSIMSAADQARQCYQQMMKADKADMYQDDLKAGAFKAGVVFETAQAQFGAWIDEMSLVLLEDVAPAAGEGTEANLEAEAQMESGMELLIDSYMLLENAQVLGAKMGNIGS